MKTLAAFALVLMAGAGGVGAVEERTSGDLKAVVASYLEIQAQLADDKIDGIKGPAAAIAASAASMGEPGAAIVTAAKAVEEAADLQTAREAFGPLSDAVIAAAKAGGWQGLDDVKLAYCPMVNGSWLQREPTIRNPYYGSAMLTCGEFKDPKK